MCTIFIMNNKLCKTVLHTRRYLEIMERVCKLLKWALANENLKFEIKNTFFENEKSSIEILDAKLANIRVCTYIIISHESHN